MPKNVKLENSEAVAEVLNEQIVEDNMKTFSFSSSSSEEKKEEEKKKSQSQSGFEINCAGFGRLAEMKPYQITDFLTTAGYVQRGYNSNKWEPLLSDTERFWLNNWNHRRPVFSSGISERDRHFSVAVEVWARSRPSEREAILKRMAHYTIQ